MAEDSATAPGPITAAAQQLVSQLDGAKLQRENALHARKVKQVRSLRAKLGPAYSQRLAAVLGQDPAGPPFVGMQWFLAEDGEENIEFDSNNDLLLPEYLPLLVANLEGYSVGAHYVNSSSTYTFGLSCGGGNWLGFGDLESFGRATLGNGAGFTWDKVKLSKFNNHRDP